MEKQKQLVRNFQRQQFVQFIVGVIEFIGIPVFLAFLSNRITPFDTCVFAEWVERVAFTFVIYEVIVIIVRKLIMDAKKDMLLAVKYAYELGELYCTSQKQDIYDVLCKIIDAQLKSKMMNSPITVKDYENLRLFSKNKDVVSIQKRKIFISHALDACDLIWELTLLLRFVK